MIEQQCMFIADQFCHENNWNEFFDQYHLTDTISTNSTTKNIEFNSQIFTYQNSIPRKNFFIVIVIVIVHQLFIAIYVILRLLKLILK